ncbi:hypothetical protein VNI00_016810 [Paramarasmius palmivorus]|uniref:F-box domain-containing protein n=1 Tax=Paramarasmius palmivorus TaxID=297713 RepID=A0AAW0BBH9_9AGAR
MLQLDGDSVLQCLEAYIQEHGSWRQAEIPLLTRTLLPRIYPMFYRNIVLMSSRSMYRLKRTLEENPERAALVRSLWVRVGRDGALAPAARDITYPYEYGPWLKALVPITKPDSAVVGQTIGLVAPFLTRLTISARLHYPRIRDALLMTEFPNVVELELPVDLVLFPDSAEPLEGLSRFQSLKKLRLVYNSEKDENTEILPYQNLANFTTLTHVYLSYWAENRSIVEKNIVALRVPHSVKIVVLEIDTGIQVPIKLENLPCYRIHPKVVFVIKRGVFEDMDKLLRHTRRMAELRSVSFLLDVTIIGGVTIWELGAQKVKERLARMGADGDWSGNRVIYRIK